VANGCFWEDHGNHAVLFGTMRVSPGVSDCSVELRTRAFKSSVARSVLSGTYDEKKRGESATEREVKERERKREREK